MRQSLTYSPLARRLAPLGALALLAVAVVHLIDGPGSLRDQFYIGALELSLAAACVPLAVVLLISPGRPVWDLALALNLVSIAIFVASRTVGLPGSSDDIGNWSQLLGAVSLLTEAVVVLTATAVLLPDRPPRH